MVRYLPSYCPDFNLKEGSYHQAKDFIRGSDVAFRCCLQRHVFILHVFTQILRGNCEGILETLVMSNWFDWINNFEPFRYIHRCFLCGLLQRGITESSVVIVNDFLNNRAFPSSLVPLFQSESKCETILMKMKLHAELIFIWKVSHLDSF